MKAIETRDGETARALASAPGGSLVTASFKVRADADFAEKNFPAAFTNFQQISVLQEQLVGLSDLTSKWLDGLGTQS